MFHSLPIFSHSILIALEPLSIKTFKTTERSGDNPQIENPGPVQPGLEPRRMTTPTVMVVRRMAALVPSWPLTAR